ncbi:MAG TPA: Maf family protein [Bacillota bacterium]|nr:Maf family protein [Bacillota bacterium]
MELILASASPRRRDLLEQLGLKFTVKVSNVEEKNGRTACAGRAGRGSGCPKGTGSCRPADSGVSAGG